MQLNAVKNVQRIRLKRKSEQVITPLAMAASRVPELLAKQKSAQSPVSNFNSNFKNEMQVPASGFK